MSPLRSAPDESEGAMACQYASWVNRRLVIAATRNWSAMRSPWATGSGADGGDVGTPGLTLAAQAASETATMRVWRD